MLAQLRISAVVQGFIVPASTTQSSGLVAGEQERGTNVQEQLFHQLAQAKATKFPLEPRVLRERVFSNPD